MDSLALGSVVFFSVSCGAVLAALGFWAGRSAGRASERVQAELGWESKLREFESERSRLLAEQAAADARLEASVQRSEELAGEREALAGRATELDRQVATLAAERTHAQERLSQLEAERAREAEKIEAIEKRMQAQFELLAARALEGNARQFRESSEKDLQGLLTPLRERIQEFQRKVEESYSSEARERFALKAELDRMVQANERITSEANALTRALKGDVKTQGNWGEVVLERILEASGLRSGQEYFAQGQGLGLKNEEGRDQRPDIIIRLPEGKHLVVDSKVSLTHYERIVSENDSRAREQHAKLFLQSLYAHIDGLARKRYQDLEGLGTPDFVILFVPIEGAFSQALQLDDGLFSAAWEKSIILVSPTTLLATLRTVASIWKQERRSRNAEEIARQAGLLYDKLAGFVGDLGVVDEKLGNARDSLEKAVSKLSTGRGNVLSKAQLLVKLGARASKALPASLLTEELETESEATTP
jgi:DNA recombination protein RmuC